MIKLLAGSQTLRGAIFVSGQKLTIELAVCIRENGGVVRDALIVCQALERAIQGIIKWSRRYHWHIKDGVATFCKARVSVFGISVQVRLLVSSDFHNED